MGGNDPTTPASVRVVGNNIIQTIEHSRGRVAASGGRAILTTETAEGGLFHFIVSENLIRKAQQKMP